MKIRITHNDILNMVNEVVNRLDYRSVLMEITSQDAYARFYQGKIPEKAYNKLMMGADQMTPLHKLAADHVVNLYANKQGRQATKLIGVVSKFWANANNESRQYAIKVCKDEADYLKSEPNMFLSAVTELAGMKSHSEGSYIDRGLEVLYEDDNVRITCTKSYSSSCRHYGKSHWCTASDQFGEYDGFNMFRRYTVNDKSVLVQFFIKSDPEETCQAQVRASNGNLGQICDFSDYSMSTSSLSKHLDKYGVNLALVKQDYINPNLKRLFAETAEIVKDETVYYRRKKAERIKKLVAKLSRAVSSNEGAEFAQYILNQHSPYTSTSNDGTWRGFSKDLNGITVVDIQYMGKTQGERDFFENYYDDEEYGIDQFGVLTDSIVYIYKGNNLLGKYPGDISIYNSKFIIITDRYDDELYRCTVNYVINTETGEVMLQNLSPINTDDCDSYIDDAANEYPDETRNALGDYNYGEWFVFADTQRKKACALSNQTAKIVEIPYLSYYF